MVTNFHHVNFKLILVSADVTMADPTSDDEQSPKITVKFKTTTDTYEVEVEEKAAVEKASPM
jgi:hypothetical protein